MGRKKKQPEQNIDIDEQILEQEYSKKIQAGEEKVGKQDSNTIECEIIPNDTTINNARKLTTLEGKNLSSTEVGQIRI